MIKEAYEAGVKYAIEDVINPPGNVGSEEKQQVATPAKVLFDEDLAASQNQDERNDNRRHRAFNTSAGSYQESTREGHNNSPRYGK